MNWPGNSEEPAAAPPSSDSSADGESADIWWWMTRDAKARKERRIAALQREIEDGTYSVAAAQVADAIIRFYSRDGSSD